jgi:hypothetical protein
MLAGNVATTEVTSYLASHGLGPHRVNFHSGGDRPFCGPPRLDAASRTEGSNQS